METRTLTTRTTRTIDPLKENPIRSLVGSIRAMETSLTPAQQAIADRDRARVDALIATGVYSLSPIPAAPHERPPRHSVPIPSPRPPLSTT